MKNTSHQASVNFWLVAAVWLIGIILAIIPVWTMPYVFIGVSFFKAILFYGLVTILALIYLRIVWIDKSYLPKFNAVTWLWLGLVVALALSTFASVQPYLSFWGTFNRTDGWLTWLYYTIFFLVVANVVKTRQHWWQVVGVSLVGGVVAVIYGLGQIMNWPGVIDSADPWRVESTLGNPVFLGIYLSLALPLTLTWALIQKKRLWKYLGFILGLLEIITIGLTLSRGAWLGAGLSLLIVSWIYIYFYHRAKLSWFVAVCLVGGGLLLGAIGLGQSLPTQSWLHTLSDKAIRSESIILRYQTYQTSLPAIYEKPILGWGLENFAVAYDQYYQALDRNINFSHAHADRPHNAFIGMAIDGGGLSLALYLALLIVAVWLIYRYVRQSVKNFADMVFGLGILGILIAYIVCMLTAFNLISYTLFFLLGLAFISQLKAIPLKWLGWFNQFRPASIIFVGIGLVVLAYWAIINPVIAIQMADQGTISFQKGEFSQAQEFFTKALNQKSYLSNPIRAQMVVLVSNALTNLGQDQSFDDLSRYITHIIPNNYKTEPYNSYYALIFGMYYGQLATVWPEFLDQANSSFERVTQLAPNKAETYWRWGNVYYLLNDQITAETKYTQALVLEPYNGVINYNVGLWYIDQNQFTKGESLIHRAIMQGYFIPPDELQRITRIWANNGYLSSAKYLYNFIIDNQSNHPKIDSIKADLAKFNQLQN